MPPRLHCPRLAPLLPGPPDLLFFGFYAKLQLLLHSLQPRVGVGTKQASLWHKCLPRGSRNVAAGARTLWWACTGFTCAFVFCNPSQSVPLAQITCGQQPCI